MKLQQQPSHSTAFGCCTHSGQKLLEMKILLYPHSASSGLSHVRVGLLRPRVATEARLRPRPLRSDALGQEGGPPPVPRHRQTLPQTVGVPEETLRSHQNHPPSQQLRDIRRILHRPTVRRQPWPQTGQDLHGKTTICVKQKCMRQRGFSAILVIILC